MSKLVRALAAPIMVIALAGALSTGCFRHQYGNPTPPPGEATAYKWNHQILWGIIAVDAYVLPGDVCGGPPAHVSTYVGPLGLLLGFITAGIYVPTTTAVWCGGAAENDTGAGDRPAPATKTAEK
jgi:hypothetical protein